MGRSLAAKALLALGCAGSFGANLFLDVSAEVHAIDISGLFEKRVDARSPAVAHVVAAIGKACEEVTRKQQHKTAKTEVVVRCNERAESSGAVASTCAVGCPHRPTHARPDDDVTT
jgi:hypothetical protein